MRLPSPSWTLWSTTFLLSSPTAAFHAPLRTRQLDTSFDWTAITPTPDLQYHDCYNNAFKCARLQVPLDWSKVTNTTNTTVAAGPHAAIAIVLLPATVPVSDPTYGGPILINPGGPGGSGTQMAMSAGAVMQGLLDVPGTRHYDILGFDPRGMALTTPSASCYGRQFDRAADWLRRAGLPSVGTELGLKMGFEMSKGWAGLCAQTAAAGGEESAFRHSSTASVARDMLEIVDRMHELNIKEGLSVGGGGKNGTGTACGEKPRLQYLGFSYGSHLGNTFASMFPGRVGRMAVDGIVDGDDYTSGAWAKNVNDGEAAVDNFYRTCFEADSACPLRESGDTSFADISARVHALLLTLQQSPVSAIYNNRVYLVTSFLVSESIRTSLYAPIAKYEGLAHTLAEALTGNFTRILSDPTVMAIDTRDATCTEPAAADPPQDYNFANEASINVICGDSQASAGTRDLAWAETTVARITNQSASIGEGWTKLPLSCSNWAFSPPYAFSGPFGSPAPNRNNSSNTPSAPLLILSTRIDHATPLANAYALSRLHGGSAVVVQESVGHCALLSSTSQCVYGIVREYFHSGTVPANGTVCAADCVPGIPFKACPGLTGF
ncbi:TAP-like protein-domain-containing protein [Chaetomidium leptoderma]|uniref:TAP-like protein-domain-containing protein n=1 Tax=Chaetomidium leptoderma TaxID=669021 RepID=A0AAN6VFC4_9PEZI|nr:TAP-like protein-domain-containing protein [Chaetomidium leptoderma]